jgi:hypothetical protein
MTSDETFNEWFRTEFAHAATDSGFTQSMRSAWEHGRKYERSLTPTAMCEAKTWPYTENNVCTLRKGHKSRHRDRKGRMFD